MIILNLGCGTKTCDHQDVINIDWSIYLRVKRNPLLHSLAPIFARGERLRRYRALPDNILVHNLARGIPFDSAAVDVVYHSHVLEHLDRDIAVQFLKEAYRVLKPGGVQRIVVPDFEQLAREYVANIDACEKDPDQCATHEAFISAMILQSVRREAFGSSQQAPLRRFIENAILGDARKRGETHQWAYDRFSLPFLLKQLGYGATMVQNYDTSWVPNWGAYGLDTDVSGQEYKPESMYIEAKK